MPSIINASSSGSGGIVQTADASGVLQLQSNGTVALNISGTNVGLGTTSPAAVAGQSLQLGDRSGVFQLDVNSDFYAAHNLYYDGTNWRYLVNGVGSFLNLGGGRANFYRVASGTAGATASLIQTFTVDNNDQVVLNLGQLKFPATQNPSSDANCLDDYEEGTFTPTINFAGGVVGITYSSQVGRYVKVGRVVTFNLYIRLANKGSSVGNLLVAGLPFTSQNTTDGYNACTLWMNTTNSSVTGVIQGYVSPNSTQVPFERFNSGFFGTLGSISNADLNNSSDIMVGGIYITSQ